ncbi:preprotein translocase subunit SecG [Comamonas flocculans]|uniref:Protein-export membrane protein SecG n=1 Tax=Comamonas flocculans TaxID=2597701 RepID=A0A5B8RSZ1_9BURK|nr:preprotein translocase subunit SecG [Comamonas flocculans]QEA11958.1 preprotein translocase subunit SecG [Comamonas flocculans]
MHLLLNIVFAVQMLTAIAMVALILVQHGKGADMGAAFGSGSAGSLFGSSGSANFLSHTTAVLATIFLVATLTLAYFGNQRPTDNSVGSVLETPAAVAPATPAPDTGAAATDVPADKPGSDSSQIPTK